MPGTDEVVAIWQLQSSYADIISRRAMPELENVFLADAAVVLEFPGKTRELKGASAFGAYVKKRIEHLDFFQYVTLNSVIDIESENPLRATGRVSFCELRQEGDSRMSVLYGVYQDVYAKVENRWWFANRRFRPIGLADGVFKVFGHPKISN